MTSDPAHEKPGAWPTELRIFTYKQGLLSSLGHDLLFHARGSTESQPEQDGLQVTLVIDPGEITFGGAVVAPTPEQPRVEVLSEEQETEILATMREDVLKISAFPSIEYRGRLDTLQGKNQVDISGSLELCGQSHQLPLRVERRESAWCGATEIAPSRWGIAPVRAMLGALKLQDRVRIEFEVDTGLTR